ncbi:MAG: hypothetical protein WCO81_02660 [Cyanobacteriota bacterium ELA615]
MLKRSILIAGLSIGSLSLANQGAHALSWTWSLVDSNGQTSSGTFTTDGFSYQAGITYTISAITGTSNINQTGQTIANIIDYVGASNTLQWDGTNSSPLISNIDGISWNNTDGTFVIIYYSFSGYSGVDSTSTTYASTNPSITSSTLTPAASTPVPFEFSPEQGFILGVPLFLGLRKLKKKRA